MFSGFELAFGVELRVVQFPILVPEPTLPLIFWTFIDVYECKIDPSIVHA